MKSVSPLGPRPRTTNPEEVTAMKGTMSAATVHKQYNEVVSAFRRLIADPALRARFDGEADGYFRRCALGVWQADNASSITPVMWSSTTLSIPTAPPPPPPCTGRWPPGWPA